MLPVFIDFEHFSTVLPFPVFALHSIHVQFFLLLFAIGFINVSPFFYLQFHLFSIILIHVHTCFLNFPKLSTIFPEVFPCFSLIPSPVIPPAPAPPAVAVVAWPGLREAGDLRRHPRAPWRRAEGAERYRDQEPRWDLVSDVKSAHLAMDQYLL